MNQQSPIPFGTLLFQSLQSADLKNRGTRSLEARFQDITGKIHCSGTFFRIRPVCLIQNKHKIMNVLGNGLYKLEFVR